MFYQPDKVVTLVALVLALCCASFVPVRAEEPRIEVATLDGAPVYHWRVFKSVVANDVDRGLILREFERKKFKVPSKLTDDAVQRKIKESAGGDAHRFEQKLQNDGVTLADFRRFTSEEIILQAMLYQKTQDASKRAKSEAEWLAGLRAQATVKMLRQPDGGS